MATGDVAAVVLAAGLSSRMGRFKPLLPAGGRTLLETVIGTFRAAGVEPLAVVGHQARLLEPLLTGLEVRMVVNPRYREEMFTSVKAGAAALDEGTKAFFLHPGDVPFFRPGTLGLMMAAGRESDVDLVRPRCRGKTGHPVLVSGGRIPSILAFHGEGGLRALVRDQAWSVFDAECDDPGVLADLDTPEDYARAVRAFAPPAP